MSDDKYQERFERSDADYDTTRALMEKLISMGTRTFIFTGRGEPFLHKNILDFAECVKLAGSICTVTTNGTLLDRSTIDELIKSQVELYPTKEESVPWMVSEPLLAWIFERIGKVGRRGRNWVKDLTWERIALKYERLLYDVYCEIIQIPEEIVKMKKDRQPP